MIIGPGEAGGDPGPDRSRSVERLFDDLREGRREALDELFPLVYQELRELAHRQRQAWRGDESLNTTALVHEAYLKLVDQRRATWESEAHFLATAARAIRQILINYARDRQARKRGGGRQRIPLSEEEVEGGVDAVGPGWEEQVVVLDRVLERLSSRDARQGRIVECRFFGGMTVQQTAVALGLSTATVMRSWMVARAWLHRELQRECLE